MSDLMFLGASAAVVAVIALVVRLAGFTGDTRIDRAALERLAAEEGSVLVDAAIDEKGRAALARLGDGRLLAAVAMGTDIAARVAPAAHVRLKRRHAVATFADVGFPALRIAYSGDAPPLLAALAQR